ncbi:MAG: serine/threonine-protein kinase [Varibaculum sp.]|nr:serine/threonine-protein kinase [Varibaculum sp.]
MSEETDYPVIPGCEYVDRCGGGGFADVLRYRDSLGRDVAVKVLRQGVDEKAIGGFEQEAMLMAKLSNHPNIVSIYQFGVDGNDRPYLIMEMYPSGSLADDIRNRVYTPAKTLAVGIQLCGAIETAHRMGVLHRDIKPANILFNDFGRPALTDFGISVAVDQDNPMGNAMSPQWAPPEQFSASAGDIGPWSDVYSLAATLWAALAGHSPMWVSGQSNDAAHLRSRAETMPVPPLDREDVPPQLEQVLRVAMSKRPEQRYGSALEFARALQATQATLSFGVTQIDVLSDSAGRKSDVDSLTDAGTRVSSFEDASSVASAAAGENVSGADEVPSDVGYHYPYPKPQGAPGGFRQIPAMMPGQYLPPAPEPDNEDATMQQVMLGVLATLIIVGSSVGIIALIATS